MSRRTLDPLFQTSADTDEVFPGGQLGLSRQRKFAWLMLSYHSGNQDRGGRVPPNRVSCKPENRKANLLQGAEAYRGPWPEIPSMLCACRGRRWRLRLSRLRPVMPRGTRAQADGRIRTNAHSPERARDSRVFS